MNQTSALNTTATANERNSIPLERQCYEILGKYFQYESFRPNQLEVITNTIKGNDSLVVMATGSGKSLCYQIPPLVTGKPAIIISPLISLIINQVSALNARGIPAIGLTTGSFVSPTQIEQAFDGSGKYLLIYLTPEGLASKYSSIKRLHSILGISCIAIDESHCVVEWGFDFRPSYLQLNRIRDHIRNVPILALTATATTAMRERIIHGLCLHSYKLLNIVSTFNRTNLLYKIKDKIAVGIDLCNKEYYANGSTIIYCSSRADCEKIANTLSNKGFSAEAYHAGMNARMRYCIQQKWEQNDVQCIVATIAFGMGIDKPDIRHVIHYGIPTSVEGYYQQTGRAGRDQQSSTCILFWKKSDFNRIEWVIGQSATKQGKQIALLRARTMKEYVYTNECRVKFILKYFNEPDIDTHFKCNRCCNCASNISSIAVRDFTIEARVIVQAVKECGQRFGITVPVNVCKGKENSSTKKVGSRLKSLESFGGLKSYSVDWIKALARKLIEKDILREEIVRKFCKIISLTPKGYQLLNNTNFKLNPWVPESDMIKADKSNIFRLRSRSLNSNESNGQRYQFISKIGSPMPSVIGQKRSFNELISNDIQHNIKKETKLLQTFLLKLRQKVCHRQGLLPYQILSNGMIEMCAEHRPNSMQAILQMNDNKSEYGGQQQYYKIFSSKIGKYCLKYNLECNLNLNQKRIKRDLNEKNSNYNNGNDDGKEYEIKEENILEMLKENQKSGLTFSQICNHSRSQAQAMRIILENLQISFQIYIRDDKYFVLL